MPTSRSPKPGPDRPQASTGARLLRPLLLIAVLAVLVVVIIALPASLLQRFLPAEVSLQDFSGTLWHGSAARMALGGRDVGALEWRVHAAALVGLRFNADLHWVKGGFVADGSVLAASSAVTLTDVQGGGPIDDLHDLGVAGGWHGSTTFKFDKIALARSGNTAALTAVVGDLEVAGLSSAQIAAGSDLGGYRLHVADPAVTPGSDAAAELTDTGGPLQVQAAVHFSADGRTGMLSGTVKARPDASPALRRELDGLGQLHARDADGAIPVDLEFTL